MMHKLEVNSVHVVSPAKDFRLFPLISKVILAILTVEMKPWSVEKIISWIL